MTDIILGNSSEYLQRLFLKTKTHTNRHKFTDPLSLRELMEGLKFRESFGLCKWDKMPTVYDHKLPIVANADNLCCSKYTIQMFTAITFGRLPCSVFMSLRNQRTT